MNELTPRDRERLSQLDTLTGRVRHVYALTEQFAGSPREAEVVAGNLRRAFAQLKQQFTTAGFDKLSQTCVGLEMTARRGMSHAPKARMLREGIVTLSRQVEVERRSIGTPSRGGARDSD